MSTERVVLDRAPDLRRLFAVALGRSMGASARARLPTGLGGSPLRRGAPASAAEPATRPALPHLPDVVVEQHAVRVDAGRLAAYCRIAGFTGRDTLPVTFAHVLAFPLQVVLLTRRDVPFAALGAIHVANEMTWHRPIPAAATLSVRVHAESPQRHRRGLTLQLCSEVFDGDELVWHERSTYLSAGPPDPGAPTSGPPEVSRLNRVPMRLRVPHDLGRRYAAVSGDWNPIHLHALSARPFGFRRPIAHGMWSYARTLAGLRATVPPSGSSAVWFRRPVLLGSVAQLALAPERADLCALLPVSEGSPHLVMTLTPG